MEGSSFKTTRYLAGLRDPSRYEAPGDPWVEIVKTQ